MKEIKSYTAITLTLIFLCGSISIYTLYRVKNLNKLSQTTEQLIKLTYDLHAKILEYEITMLNFAMTFDSVFLDSVHVAKTKIDGDVEKLSDLIGADEIQKGRLDSIRSMLARRQAVFANSLLDYPTADDQLKYVRLNRKLNDLRFGKEIKGQIDELLSQQRKKLTTGELGLLSNLSALSIVIFTITSIGILAAGLNFYSIHQYNLAQKGSDQEIKDYQNKLNVQIEQLNSTNRELEQFAYVASHDLQEPLRKITSFNDLLQDQYKGVLEGDGKLYLERIAYAATRMRKLISDLLEYSRAGTYAEDKESIKLNDVIDEILDDLSVQIEHKKASVHVDKLPEIVAHHADWRMVFQNLISNAIKYGKSNEAPTIGITYQVASEKLIAEKIANRPLDMSYHHIKVTDKGIGFKNEYANKIFTIFQRLHGKDEYEGTGIGLAICKKIVERYGGVIFAKSKVNQGSSFQILVPFEQMPTGQN